MFTFPASRSFWKHPVLLWSLYLSISGAKGQDFQSPTSMPVACFFSITSKKPQEVSHDEVTRFYPSILQVSSSPGSSLSQFHKTWLLTCSSSWRRHVHTYTYIDTIINIAWSNTFYSSMCLDLALVKITNSANLPSFSVSFFLPWFSSSCESQL